MSSHHPPESPFIAGSQTPCFGGFWQSRPSMETQDPRPSMETQEPRPWWAHAQPHCPHVRGQCLCFPELEPVVTQPSLLLVHFISSLCAPSSWQCHAMNKMSHIFCSRTGSPSSQGHWSLQSSYYQHDTLFFPLPAVYCWELVWSEPVTHEHSNKKVTKPRGSNLMALVSFLCEGRRDFQPSLEMKLLLTTHAGGQ